MVVCFLTLGSGHRNTELRGEGEGSLSVEKATGASERPLSDQTYSYSS